MKLYDYEAKAEMFNGLMETVFRYNELRVQVEGIVGGMALTGAHNEPYHIGNDAEGRIFISPVQTNPD